MLRLALLIDVPVIAFEQLLHTRPAALQALPVYHALHWLSDALLALPLAVAAIWGGRWLANRLALGSSEPLALLSRACLICVLFAILLVPGAALHDEADKLSHAHAFLAIHNHRSVATQPTSRPMALARATGHALSDGLEGQLVGLPLIFGALVWGTRGGGRRMRTP
jgi:hypothetical protein